MKVLIVLVGLQGAGKTTTLALLNKYKVLRPSTTRPRRPNEPDEYHFETNWNPENYAWDIMRGTIHYGMRKDELDQISDVGLTVFDPANIATLDRAKPNLNFEVITIGLDTISSLGDQHQRVGNENARKINSAQDFSSQLSAVKNCDVVLSGDLHTIVRAIESIIHIVAGRGGLLEKNSINNLISAGALLHNAVPENIKSASYDLRLADKYWCMGALVDLTDSSPVLIIPPYSFVLVQSIEEAWFPRIITGSFDLKVSMFFNGLILSNGPQVDPGYRGALFCLLYNASDSEFALSRGQHFATIQFNTTANVAEGYSGKYQDKVSFVQCVDGRDLRARGGRLLERLDKINDNVSLAATTLKGQIDSAVSHMEADFADAKQDLIAKNIETKNDLNGEIRNNILYVAGAGGLLLSVFLAIFLGWIFPKFDAAVERANQAADKATQASDKVTQEIDKLKQIRVDKPAIESVKAASGEPLKVKTPQ